MMLREGGKRIRDVAERLLPLMRASGLFGVGDETELPNLRTAACGSWWR
ncbi:hypothetical protein [Actinomadura xylanilytica]|nr:hypothetical protein [Actinomadura xylanilytica]MDL4771232.1 hypothetical protein [Actinomadura xylanilytica]